MILRFPADEPVGTVVGWVAEPNTPPRTIGPAVGDVEVDYPRAGLYANPALTDLRFLERVDGPLESITLGDSFPPDHLRYLPVSDLQSLGLSGSRVTDEAVEAVAACRALRQLILTKTNLSADGLRRLAHLPIRALTISDSSSRSIMDDEVVRWLVEAWPALESLVLTGARIADSVFEALGRLSHLEALWISDVDLTGESLGELAAIKPLQRLILISTALGDDAFLRLSSFPSLIRVNVRGTKVTAGAVAALAATGVQVVSDHERPTSIASTTTG